jgi:hypothetical protein
MFALEKTEKNTNKTAALHKVIRINIPRGVTPRKTALPTRLQPAKAARHGITGCRRKATAPAPSEPPSQGGELKPKPTPKPFGRDSLTAGPKGATGGRYSTIIVADVLTPAPTVLTAKPDSLTAAPIVLTAVPDFLTAAPTVLTAMPDSLTAAPAVLTAGSDSLTAASIVLTAGQQSITITPKGLTAAPEFITIAPHALTVAPPFFHSDREFPRFTPYFAPYSAPFFSHADHDALTLGAKINPAEPACPPARGKSSNHLAGFSASRRKTSTTEGTGIRPALERKCAL